MIDKNDYTIYKKYEGDRRNYNYNFDMIKDELLKAVEGLIIEDKVIDYIDDIETIVEQIVEELNDANSDLNDLEQDQSSLEEEKNELEGEIRYLKDILEEQENSENGRKE